MSNPTLLGVKPEKTNPRFNTGYVTCSTPSARWLWRLVRGKCTSCSPKHRLIIHMYYTHCAFIFNFVRIIITIILSLKGVVNLAGRSLGQKYHQPYSLNHFHVTSRFLCAYGVGVCDWVLHWLDDVQVLFFFIASGGIEQKDQADGG